MTYEELRAKIIGRMQAFDGIGQERIDYQNPAYLYVAPPEGLWCRLSIEVARPVVQGLCEPSTRIPGHIIIQCFHKTKNQVPTLELTRLADKLVEHFQFWNEGGLLCREAQVVNVSRKSEYSQANVLIYFIAD